LQQVGLIKFKPGGNGSRGKCVFEIIEADKVIDKVSINDTLSDGRYQNLTPYPHPNLEPYPYPYQQKTDYINKHKPNQTKPNNTFSGDGAPVKKKMDLEKTFFTKIMKLWQSVF